MKGNLGNNNSKLENLGIKLQENAFLVFFPLITLVFIDPAKAIDPLNPIKLAFLVATTGFLALTTNWQNFVQKRNVTLLTVSGIFLFALSIPIFLTSAPVLQQFFGISGRNTGYLHYLCLTLILLMSSQKKTVKFEKRLFASISITGFIETIYAFIQLLQLDPFGWNIPEGWIIGTFGNPDFLSAFLAFAVISNLFIILELVNRVIYKVLIAASTLVTIYVMIRSGAMQGIILSILGISLILLPCIWRKLESIRYRLLFACFLISAIACIILGFLQKGPLARILYQESITLRGDYWRAAWRMTLDHPLTGVGLDSYGDWYRQSQSDNSAIRKGSYSISNAAHNVFLDMSASGGFPLLLAYVLIVLLTLSAIIYLTTQGLLKVRGNLLVIVLWILFQAQSTISLNVASLAIWGFLFSGLIIGKATHFYFDRLNTLSTETKITPIYGCSRSLGLVIKLVLILPLVTVSLFPQIRDSQIRMAITNRDSIKLMNVATSWPQDSTTIAKVAYALYNSGNRESGLKLARIAIRINPRSYESWFLIASDKSTENKTRQEAISMLNKLYPFG
jgi:O-antigen ligase